MNLPVYLDSSATTPCDPGVVEAMLPFFTQSFGNAASRFHFYGWEAGEAVENARLQIARLIGAKPAEIIFTSGATESCNLAIKGVNDRFSGLRRHIITVSTEHKAVLETITFLEKSGCEVTVLNVDSRGLPDPGEVKEAIRPHTMLIAVMYANNETGVINPVGEIAEIAAKHKVLFFSDATQVVGKIPVDAVKDGFDLMAFTAHKMYGPKGIGALYVRSRPAVDLRAQILGGHHERGYRSGTLNVPGIVGFGKAALLAKNEIETIGMRMLARRIKLEKSLLALPGVHLNGDPANRLPHVTNVSVEEVESERLLLHLSSKLAMSSGAACSSATNEPSHVLKAMGVTGDRLFSSIRLSQGRYTTNEEIDFTIGELTKAIILLRSDQSGTSNTHRQPFSFSA